MPTPEMLDERDVRRFWREMLPVSYLARRFDITEAKVLEICVGDGVPYDPTKYLTRDEIAALARKAAA